MNVMADKKIRVLLIEDNPCDVLIIRGMLINNPDSSFEVEHATTLAGGVEILERNEIDVILSDLGLPDSYGMETFIALHSRFQHMPIIVMSGMDDESMAVDAVKKGAQDYLVKGNVDGNCLRQSLRYAIERKHSEEVLRTSEERYRRITDSVTDYIFTVYYENGQPVRTVHGSTSVAVTGYTPEEFNADKQLWIKMVFPQDRDVVTLQAQKCIAGEALGVLEHRIIRKDGVVRWVQNTMVRQYDLEGNLLSYDGLIRDIDERKRAEEALRRQRDTAKNYFDIAGVMLVAINVDSIVTSINKRGCEILGYEESEIVGQNWFDICIPEQDRQQTKDYFQKFIAGQNEYLKSHENYVLTKHGKQRLIFWNNRVLKDDNGIIVGTLSSGEDVTETRRYEEELKKSTEQAETARAQIEQVNLQLKETYNELIETSRQAGMAEVATDVLHNVGNVLNSVNVLATFIKEKVMKSEIPNLKKVADMIQQNMNDLPKFLTEDKQGKNIPIYLVGVAGHIASEQVEIIEKLNSLTNNINHIKEIVKMQQFYSKVSGVEIITSIDDIIEDAIEINDQGLRKRNIEIVRDYVDLGLVKIDKQRVLQIMVNLITNAQHALDESENKEKSIVIRIYKANNDIVNIEVMDNGIGIDQENLTKIFRHGFTTKKHGNGFGLHSGALAAKEMGGALTVESAGPGKGSVFTLQLPLRQVEMAQCN